MRGMGLVEKPKNFWQTTGRLLGYMKGRLVAVIFVLIMAIASVYFQIRTPKILGKATTQIFAGVMKVSLNKRQGFTSAPTH